LHPDQNSNKRLNSAYARMRADAIADPLWRPRNIFRSAISAGHSLVTNECLNFKWPFETPS
jgi:hypothetical protein